MPPNFRKLCILLTLVFINPPVKCNFCTISNLDKIDGYCTAQIDCNKEINFDVKAWNCIQHTRSERHYDPYGGYYKYNHITDYDDNYYLLIHVTEPLETDSLLINENHFIKLIMEHGDLLAIPQDVYKMNNLNELNISGNKIGTVNLNDFLSMSKLRKVILNNNMIHAIETNKRNNTFSGLQFSNIEMLDLSSNEIYDLPNNFVARFVQLQDLNLSHNMISSIGILTFEGIVQLQTLDLSHNRLLEIGHALARFTNLKELSISHNNITKMFSYDFATLINLEKLNASSNCIATIENTTFQTLTKLKYLDLRRNFLIMISNQFFVNNIFLTSLFLSDNKIKYIEQNSFKAAHLTKFCIKNNSLIGNIKENTFQGLNVSELNLSGESLTGIESKAFSGMVQLKKLNLSLNSISNLSDSAFSSLVSLNILDLSNNKLKTFNFSTVNLKNLTKLYAHHNNIEKIMKHVFDNFVSLKELDLSFNDLRQIEPGAFKKINNIELFNIKNSNFASILESKVFQGLISLKRLDMSRTKTTLFKNESFSGLISLTEFNYTFGQLSEIEYNAFVGSNVLEKLILSNNQLQQFHVNTSCISLIEEIYLNNNCIRNISSESFANLTLLRILNLASNGIIEISTSGFQGLNSLTHLDLSSNNNMEIIGNPFQNLSRLYSLSLENVKLNTSFQNSSACIEILSLKSCGISDINKIYIFYVKGLSHLYLSMNEITTIDKHSFRNLSTLVSLDLSLNKIVFIQPGSFLYLNKLRNLNFYSNDLTSIQYGVFDGIEVLEDLNLSSNLISNFDAKLLPNTEKLFLDDNIIVDINLEEFLHTNLSKLSIGGNAISCRVLIQLKTSQNSENFKKIITAKTLDYHSENVDGITCQTITNITSTANDNLIVKNPSTSPLIKTLRNILDKLSQSVQIMTENNNVSNNLKNNEKNLTILLEDIIKIKNNSHNMNTKYLNYLSETNNISNWQFGKYLNQLTKMNNDSNVQLQEIKTYLAQVLENKKEFGSDSILNTKSPIDDQFLRLEFKTMLKQENDVLREEFKNALASIVKDQPIKQSLIAHDKISDDFKSVIYFIAACLVIIMSVYIGNLVYKLITVSRRSHFSQARNSTTHMAHSIEME